MPWSSTRSAILSQVGSLDVMPHSGILAVPQTILKRDGVTFVWPQQKHGVDGESEGGTRRRAPAPKVIGLARHRHPLCRARAERTAAWCATHWYSSDPVTARDVRSGCAGVWDTPRVETYGA